MKAVILAGGRGTRISEESHLRPKPMITIGDKPILWHIMKIYAAHGITDFIVCLGYRGHMIKEYFLNYSLHATTAVTFDLANRTQTFEDNSAEPWRVTLVETGADTQTGGRVKRVANWLDDDEPFCLTYGDGLADIDISSQLKFHKAHGGLATVAAVAPAARFGVIETRDDGRVDHFAEKPNTDGGLINGGFFVLSKSVIDRISADDTIWEREPLESLAQSGELFAYPHTGFWQPMDTLREREQLELLWASGDAPWKVW
ncbi:glucose-1-phosphate cytidylyltransferase [Parvibaculaceae bacterium PLY_AMNH_Bact1]|nr:glucose-1-phosphate cytidylyltransferase [Parvibaculaceae bacterium PLY_AMNH_Bact1]